MSQSRKLEGKVALVTGGTTGIGFATARRFVEEGARVIITGQDAERLARAARELPAADPVRVDAARQEDADRLFEHVKQRYDGLDVLFLNAGVGKFAPVAETPEALFDEIMTVNFKGPYFMLQRAIPLLRKGASVLFNTSINAHMGMAGTSVYAASKASLITLARVASAELAERGIRVNALSPGPVQTPIFGKLGLPPAELEAFASSVREQTMVGRFGDPEEIANAALFLASSESSFLVGTEVIADGGMTAR